MISWILLLGFSAQASWEPYNDADIILNRANTTVDIKKDGNYIEEDEHQFTAKNETGRNKLALQAVKFSPDLQTLQIISAVSITDGVETPVDLKTIQERAAAGPKEGITGIKELVIPFTNLKIGSSVKYKYKMTSKKPLYPGFFAMGFMYGAEWPEMAGIVKIRSEKKIFYSAKDVESNLKIDEGKDGEIYTLTITQLRPVVKKLKDETLPIIPHGAFPEVQVTTIANWQEFATLLADRYERVLQQDLPPAFKTIVDKAAKKKDLYEKIDIVTSELATVMTYSGNWTTLDKMFYPRSQSEVATSKIGDCKDFATSTVAMLRKLGISANVALVGRRSPYHPAQLLQTKPLKDDLAMPSLFNHAIVRVEGPDKKVFWVDPTNITSNSRLSKADVSGSATLNVSKDTTKIETVPFSKIEESVAKIEKTLKILPDETGESEGTVKLTGAFAEEPIEMSFRDNAKKADEVAAGYFGSSPKDGSATVKTTAYKSRVADKFEAQVKVFGEKIYGEKEKGSQIHVTLPSILNVYFAGRADRRATDFYSTVNGRFESVVKVQGYDFNEEDSNGCLVMSPWFEVERKLIKVEKGFEVRDVILFKKDMISAQEISDDEYNSSLADMTTCIRAQDISVKRVDSHTPLAARLVKYNMAEIRKLDDAKGPQRFSSALRKRGMALQLLEKTPDDVELKVELVKSYRWIGYRHGEVWGPLYLTAAQRILDEVLAVNPKHAGALIQKAYYLGRQHQYEEAKKYFTKAYYASEVKDYEIYSLGGYITEKTKQPQMALNSYMKALETAKFDSDRASIYRKMAYLEKDSLGDLHKAEEYFDMAVKFAPGDAWLMNDVLLFAKEKGDYDKAIRIGERMLLAADFGMGRRNLADAFGRKARLFLKTSTAQDKAEIAAEIAMRGMKYDEECFMCGAVVAEVMQEHGERTRDPDLVERANDLWKRLWTSASTEEESQIATAAMNKIASKSNKGISSGGMRGIASVSSEKTVQDKPKKDLEPKKQAVVKEPVAASVPDVDDDDDDPEE